MAKAPSTRNTRSARNGTPRRVNRAKSAVNRVDSQLRSTVATVNVSTEFKSHAMIKLIGDHWSQVNTGCYQLATFMPILHNPTDIKTVSDILDRRVDKANDFIEKQKTLLDNIEGEAGVVGKFGAVNALKTEATITSRLAVRVFSMLEAADALLDQAARLWLSNHMSDDEHTKFVAKVNKEARAVCVNIREQHKRLINQLRAQRNSDTVKAKEDELKKAGVDLDADDAETAVEHEPAETSAEDAAGTEKASVAAE